MLLHWPLADGGLFVYGGDNIRLVVKASYRMNAAEVETGVISSSSRGDKKKAEAGRERREGELRRLGAARNTLRFFTRERCVHVPQQASGMTATLRGGRYGRILCLCALPHTLTGRGVCCDHAKHSLPSYIFIH